jgi:putative ABC transport system permease protein
MSVAERPATESFALLADAPARGHGNLRLLETVPSALGALRSNKGRSILTTLGIIIGVAAVIAIVAMGQGATSMINSQLAGLGTNLLIVSPGSPTTSAARSSAGTLLTLKPADADAIAGRVGGLSDVSPVVSGPVQVIAGNQNWSTVVQGVTPEYLPIENWTIASGTAFSAQDNAESNSVAIIGQTVATKLFPSGDSPIGQQIRIRNVPVTVIGVLAPKGGMGPFGDQDDTVLVPFQTAQVRLFGSQNINQIVIQVTDASSMSAVSDQVTTVLRQQHRLAPDAENDFRINNNQDIISRVSSVTGTLTTLLAGVAAVSLVVGGVGIMNIMLVSVTERTREIGIRLAIGAQPGDVLRQFLIEAIVLSLLGGGIGVVIGCGVAILFQVALGWTVALPWTAMVLSFAVAAAIGMFFGIYPARKASRLDPIVALRTE